MAFIDKPQILQYTTSTPSADLTATGLKLTLTAGENVAYGDVCYIKSDGKLWKANGSALATTPITAMSLGTITANNAGEFVLNGLARNDAWAWTVGGFIYLATSAGTLTQTAPAGANNVVQVVGVALSATVILFNPQLVLVEHV